MKRKRHQSRYVILTRHAYNTVLSTLEMAHDAIIDRVEEDSLNLDEETLDGIEHILALIDMLRDMLIDEVVETAELDASDDPGNNGGLLN